MIYYNPLDKFYKSKLGAIKENAKIYFRVKGDFGSVIFVLKKDGDFEDQKFLMTNKGGYFELEISLEKGLYFYYFALENGRFIGNGDMIGVVTDCPERFQLTVYDKSYCVPKWLNGGIIYQIFPDRFFRAKKNKKIDQDKILHENWNEDPIYLPNEEGEILNNDFFGGDLKGIVKKLPYLKKLNVSAIYLNPIFKAYSNHRYDTGDYMQIDPILGDESDLTSLIEQADELEIKIILDGVFNHTGVDSIYFNKYGKYDSIGAYQSKNSKYYNWFDFKEYPNKYESWWGIKTLPAVNEDNKDYVDFITGKGGVIDHYTKLGIGGWRLDVVDELPSDFVKNIRKAVKKAKKDAIIIGEVWEDASNKISYAKRREYFQGKELDSVMNYPLKNAIIDFVKTKNIDELSNVIKTQLDHYPTEVVHSLMNMLSTHDTCRLITNLSGEDMTGKSKTQMAKTFISGRKKLKDAQFMVKAASLIQYTVCGVPSLYYGDEIGLQGYIDPLNRRTYPWGKENKELLSWFEFLGTIRATYSAFSHGDFIEIYKNRGVYVYQRADANSELMIAINLNDSAFDIKFKGDLKDLISNGTYKNKMKIKPRSLALLVNEK